jgi:DNA-binding NarL/FixJ family response regulator
MIKIIIFSGIRIYSEGLSRILSSQEAFELAGADNSLENALVKVEQSMPHMILLDMTMPRSCGFARQVRQSFPQVKIIAIAVPEDEQNIFECAEAGISGYVAREASVEVLIKTLISADKGEFCCPPHIAANLFNKVQNLASGVKDKYLTASGPDAAFLDLTRREKQILGLMAGGLSNKEIAKALVIEVSTVKNHVHNILVKLEVHSRSLAVALYQSSMQSGGCRSFSLGVNGEFEKNNTLRNVPNS